MSSLRPANIRLRKGQASVVLTVGIVVILVAVCAWFAYSFWGSGGSDVRLTRLPSVDTSQLSQRAQKMFESCEESVRINPDDPSGWGLLGRACLAHHFDEAASQCFEVAAELDPDNFEWNYCRALATADPSESIELIQKSVEQSEGPKDQMQCKVAELMFDESDFESSKSILEMVLENQPNHLRANLLMSRLLLIENKLDESLRRATIVYEGDPNRKETLRLLSQIHSRLGNSQEASDFASRADDPKTYDAAWPDPIFQKVLALRKDVNKLVNDALQLPPQMINERIQILRSAVEEEPHEPNWHGFLGQSLLQVRQYDAAAEALKRGTELHPQSSILHYTLGLVYLNQGQMPKAIDSLESAVSLKKDYDSAFLNLGIAYRENKELEKAIGAFQKSLAILPGNFKAQLNLSVTLELAEQPEEAIRSYRECLKLNNQSAEVHLLLGKLLAKKPEGKAEARALLERALELDGTLVEAQRVLDSLLP